MAQRKRPPAKRRGPVRAAAKKSGGGGGTPHVRGSASVSASAGNGWLSGWFNNFALIRVGSSGGSGGRGSLRKAATGFLGAVQGARTGSRAGAEGMDGVGCVDCGGAGYHDPGCGQADEVVVDVDVIDDHRAIGSRRRGIYACPQCGVVDYGSGCGCYS